MRIRTAFTAAALALTLHATASARARNDWRVAEQNAHRLELAGKMEEACREFAATLITAAQESSRQSAASPAQSKNLAAWCEVLAENAYQLTHWTYKPGLLRGPFESARSVVSRVDTPVHRELTWWLTYRLASIAERLGRDDRAGAEYRRLGFVTDWRVIGPFENQKGGGFATPYPPERELRFDAQYKGKKRPVKWRDLPVRPRDGVVDLDAMFRPREECIAYAVTFVRADEKRIVDLRVSTDDGYALWVNGAKAASRPVERACRFDQDVVRATFVPGWNAILLKVADMHLDWEFSLRITDESGRVARGLDIDSRTAREVTPQAHDGPPPPPRVGGAADHFSKRIASVFECSDGSFVSAEVADVEFLRALIPERARDDEYLEALRLGAARGAPAARAMLTKTFVTRPGAHWTTAHAPHVAAISKEDVARLHYGLARLLSSRGAHGVKDHPDRAAVTRALEIVPGDPVRLYALSRVATDWVVMAAERNENPRVRILNDLLRAEPGAAVAHYELASYYLRSQGNVTRAVEHAHAALQMNDSFPLADLILVDAADKRGFSELAATRLGRLVKKYPENVIIQGRAAHELASKGRHRDAHRVYAKLVKSDAGIDSYRHGVVSSLISAGKPYAAIQIERAEAERRPADTAARVRLGRLYEAKGDYRAAADAYRDALAIAPEDHEILERLGRALQDLGKGDEAQSAWRVALDLAPNFVKLERYLEFVEGRVTYDKRLAEDVSDLIDRARSYVPPENDPLVEVLDKRIDKVNVDGTRSRTVHRLVLVRNNSGVEELGTPHVFHYPDEQVVKIRTVRVHRADGSVEEAPTGYGGRKYPAGYGGRSAQAIEFPPLRSGDIVEYEYRVDDIRQGFFGNYFGERVNFQSSRPRLRAVYVLVAPKERRLHFHVRGGALEPVTTEWPDVNAVVRTWTADAPAKLRNEPLMPPAHELGLQLQVSTYGTWAELGAWYWNLVKEAHQTSPELGRFTQELVEGADSEREKIRRVYDFVSSEIQYSAWEFGVHGFKPYRATKIFDQRFGDCKDKATLMKTMLALVGIESHPVLVEATMRRPEEDLALPLFAHFNHMILYIPAHGEREALWLDGTTTLHSMDVVPVSDAGAQCCVIYPDGAKIMRIPLESPSGNSLTDSAEFDISLSSGKLSAKATVHSVMKGWSATFARFRYSDPDPARRMLERLYARQFPGARIPKATTSDLERSDAPVEVRFEAYVPELGAARARGGAGPWFFQSLQSPFRGAFRGDWGLLAPEKIADYTTLARREHDLVIAAPWRYEATTIYRLPEGIAFTAVPEDVDLESDLGRCHITYALRANGPTPGRELTVHKIVEIRANRIPADEYEEFRRFANRADRAEMREIGVSGAR